MTLQKNSEPTLFILGARGFLGRFAAAAAQGTYRVVRGDRDTTDPSTNIAVDITDAASVHQAFKSVKPDAVLLLAAISDIDRCERDEALARSVNFQGALNVASACRDCGARLLFTSTGAVYDGLQASYHEDAPATPISTYGQTKADAEAAILDLLPAEIVVRVSLVLGRSAQPGTNSLVDNLIRRWESGQVVYASPVEARNPIDAATLSRWFVELLQNPDAAGILHAGSTELVTRFQIAQALAVSLGFSVSLVQPETIMPAGRAPRGVRQFLIPDRILRYCHTPAPTWEEVLKRSLYEPAQADL